MNDLTEVYQAINAVSQKVNDVNKKLDMVINLYNDQRKTETSENDAAIVELAEIISEMEAQNG
jgi:hypothetical protein